MPIRLFTAKRLMRRTFWQTCQTPPAAAKPVIDVLTKYSPQGK